MAESEIVVCVPCQSTGETFPSVKYCINCSESMCKTCVEFHLKFGATKSHKLVDCSTHDTRLLKGAKQLSTYMTCPDHDDSTVQLLCEEHNALCCLTCASTMHRNCRTVSEIKKIAAGCKTSGSIDKTRTRLDEAGACMQEIIDVNAACRADFEDSKEKIPRMLEEIKMKILKIFERMESAVLESVKNLHADEDIAMGDREEKWKLKMNANTELIETLDALSEVGTESQVFVTLHKMKYVLMETEKALSEQGVHIEGQRLNLELKDKLKSFLQIDVIDNLVVVEAVRSQYQLPKTVIFSKHGFDVEDTVSASDSIDDHIEGAREESGINAYQSAQQQQSTTHAQGPPQQLPQRQFSGRSVSRQKQSGMRSQSHNEIAALFAAKVAASLSHPVDGVRAQQRPESELSPAQQRVPQPLLPATKTDKEPAAARDKQEENCVICMDTVNKTKKLKCGHVFCTDCIDSYFSSCKKVCPTCGVVCGVIKGDQPPGRMDVRFDRNFHCAGFEGVGTHVITYSFDPGKQGADHPNPGRPYKGITRTAFLPDTREGREVLKMLEIAFDRKLVFTIGSSWTTGQEGVITWNDIHHKTNPKPNTPFGYPDDGYLDRVKDELVVKGVTPEDIAASHRSK